MELGTVYATLGSEVIVVEALDAILTGADPDLARPVAARARHNFKEIRVKAKVLDMATKGAQIRVTMEYQGQTIEELYDRVLVAVGRVPNGKSINAQAAGIRVDERGFIPVDRQMRTGVPGIFAIGDITGQPMLAHKATHEGKVAAEVAAGRKSSFDARVIPSVAYTDPEIAWVGVTETEAKAQGRKLGKGLFPWAASGRSLALNRDEGFTKLLFDPESHRVVGGGIVGTNAGDLISEVALAVELGADAADVGLTIHPHPTLSETVAFAAEAFEGTLTDLYVPKKGS
jgi:dihydrolipoamide dehydrogenase